MVKKYPSFEYKLHLNAINTVTSPLNEGEPASIDIDGDCIYKIDSESLEENRIQSIGSNWINAEGEGKVSKGVYLYAVPAIADQPYIIPYKAKINL